MCYHVVDLGIPMTRIRVGEALQAFEGAARRFADVLSRAYSRRKELAVIREELPTVVEDYIQQVIRSVDEGSWSRLVDASESLRWDSLQVERAFKRVNREVDSDLRERVERVSSSIGWLFMRLYRFYNDARRAIFKENELDAIDVLADYLQEATDVIRRETAEIRKLLDD